MALITTTGAVTLRFKDHYLSLLMLALLLAAFLLPVWLEGRTIRDSACIFTAQPWDTLRPADVSAPPDIDPTSYTAIQPSEQLARELVHQGKGFAWNPYVGFGQPWIGAMIASPYFPLKVLQWIFPYRFGSELELILLLYLAGAGCYLLCISLGLSPASALVAAVSYMFCERLVVFINMPNFQIETLLPLMLFAIHRMSLFHSLRYAILAGWIGATQFLGGFPETSFIFCLVAAAFFGFLIQQEPQRRHWKILLFLGGVVLVITLLISGFQLAEFARYLKLSYHYHVAKIGMRPRPFSELISAFIPFFFGLPFEPVSYSWTSLPGSSHFFVSLFCTVPALILALAGLIGRHACRGRLFFLGCLLVTLGFDYGAPGLKLIGKLPLFDVANQIWNLWLAPLSVAILAGYGMHTLLHGPRSGYKVLMASVFCTVTPLVCMRGYASPPPDALEHLIRPGWRLIAFSITVVAAALVWLRTNKKYRLAGSGLILASLFFESYYVAGKAGYSHSSYFPPNPPIVEWMVEHTRNQRIFGLNAWYRADTLLADRIRDFRHLDAMHGRLYANFSQAIWPGTEVNLFIPGQPLWTKFDSKLLDLAAVRYLVAPAGFHDAPADMIDTIMSSSKITTFDKRLVSGAAAFTIQGEQRRVLFAHPPANIEYKVTVPADGRLYFGLGEEPKAWTRPGDGTLFELTVSDEAGNRVADFQRFYDPKHNMSDRHWVDGMVNLTASAGRTVTVVLSTKSGQNGTGNNGNGWDGWSSLHWGSDKFIPVFWDGQTSIFRNTNAASRASFVPFHRDASPNFAPGDMLNPSFDFEREVYLWNYQQKDTSACPASGKVKAPVEYLQDDPDVERFKASAPCDGFFVLADLYYPGWKATIDGKPAKIYNANYAFRAIALPAGHHDIVFRYAPWTITMGLPAAILGFVGSALVLIFIRSRREPAAAL